MNNFNENTKIIGRVRLFAKNKKGEIKWDTGWLDNIITNTGLAEIIRLIGFGLEGTRFSHLAVGSSSVAESSAHTGLQAEITTGGLGRASAIVTQITTTITNDTMRLAHTWTATAPLTVEEIGIFNAPTGGIMLGRKITGTRSVVAGETLTGEYDIRVA